MQRIVEGYFTLLKVVIVACLAVMVVLVFGNVVLRYGFNSGITVSEEISRWLFVWLTFLGAIVALREHGHLGVDMLVAPAAAHRARRSASSSATLLMLYVTWLLLDRAAGSRRRSISMSTAPVDRLLDGPVLRRRRRLRRLRRAILLLRPLLARSPAR